MDLLNEYCLRKDIKIVDSFDHSNSISSQVFLVEYNGVEAVLKLLYDSIRIRRELHALSLLKDLDFIPNVIDYFISSELNVILMDKMPGTVVYEDEVDDEYAKEMGKFIAKIHKVSASSTFYDIGLEKNFPNGRDWLDYNIKRSFTQVGSIIDKKTLNKVWEYHMDNHPNIEVFDGPLLVHRDYRPGNTLAINNRQSAVIDFEAAISGFSQIDFSQMDIMIWRKDISTKQSFVDGYSSERRVPDLSILKNLRISRCLGGIGFTITRDTWNKDSGKHMFEDLLCELHATIG